MTRIEPSFRSKEFVRFKGKRKVVTNSIVSTYRPGLPFNIPFPKTDEDTAVLPETIELEFKFKSANNKSWFKNNLGSLLMNDLVISIGGKTVYKMANLLTIGVYEDLWLSEEERENMVESGIASEDVRKLWCGVEPKPTDATAVLLYETTPYLRVKMDRVFTGNGAVYPHGIAPILTVITFPPAGDIMVAATGSKVEGYTIVDLRLRFEAVSCNGLREEDREKGTTNLAMEASREYTMGKQLFFDAPFFIRQENYPKEANSSYNIAVNTARSMINGVIILFKDPDSTDSEKFENGGIEEVNISVEAEQNVIFTNSLRKRDLYNEARRVFGKIGCVDQMTKEKFHKDSYCLAIDFRTINQDNVVASGIRLKGTQEGIKLRIKKGATTKDLQAYIYVLTNRSVDIVNGLVQNLVK